MLVDTGSAVSLIREDVGREIAQSPMDHLTQPARPIVAANGWFNLQTCFPQPNEYFSQSLQVVGDIPTGHVSPLIS